MEPVTVIAGQITKKFLIVDMSTQSIQGEQITREEAYEGLGDPKTWPAFEKRLMRKFKAKPKKKNVSK